MLYLLWLIFGAWVIIYPGTDYWVRYFAPKIIKSVKPQDSQIYLTFDDGPNPDITPKVLEILAGAQVPATFFLVGWRAEKAPALVKQMINQGHEIGYHTYYHQHAYSMFITKSINTILKGKQVVESIHPGSVKLFRPPWGALNLFQYLLLKQLQLKIVLWSANASDWNVNTGPDEIVKKLSQKVKPGSIIVIHDAGGDPGAPDNMLKALPEIIRVFKEQQYQFSTLKNIRETLIN